MTYRFRLRWRFEHGRSFGRAGSAIAVALGLAMGECELKVIGARLTMAAGIGIEERCLPFRS